MVRKQLLNPALYRYSSISSNKLSLAFRVTNAFFITRWIHASSSTGCCILVPGHLHRTHARVCVFTPGEHGDKTTSFLCDKTRLWLRRKSGQGDAPCRQHRLCCVSLPLPYRVLYHPRAWHTHLRSVMPQGTSDRASAVCYKQLLWAAEQSLYYSGEGVSTSCESRFLCGPPFQSCGGSHLRYPTAVQALSDHVSTPFSRQNNLAHIPCFFPSSALLRSYICSQIFHHNTSLSTHDTLLSACVRECSPHPVSVLRLQVLPPRHQKSLSGWNQLLSWVITAGLTLEWAVVKNDSGLSEELSMSSMGGCTEF